MMDSLVEDFKINLGNSCTNAVANDSGVDTSTIQDQKCFIDSEAELISDGKTQAMEFTDMDGSGDILHIGEKLEILGSEGIQVKKSDGDAVRCALKIEVIDDIAIIGTAKIGNGCDKENVFEGSMRNLERNGNTKNKREETKGMKKKRPGGRGKGGKQIIPMDGKETFSIGMIEAQYGCERKGDGPKKFYNREEMEALRLSDVEEQRKKWIEVYCGLGPAVAREYDGLVAYANQKIIHSNLDPRAQYRMNETSADILGQESSVFVDVGIEKVNPSDPAYDVVGSDIDGCMTFEEDGTQDDDSDEDYNSIQRPAFFVTGEPDFDSGPPEDGFEYLRRVRWEAAQVPKVKIAKIESSKLTKEQTVYMPYIPDIAECPEHLIPMKAWEHTFLMDFSEIRRALSRHEGSGASISGMPLSMPVFHVEEECLRQQHLENPSPKSSLAGHCDNYPSLSAILGMDSLTRVSALKKRIGLVENLTSLSRSDCVWLFALCAAVDTPLHPDTSAALRGLLRKCACLRAEKLALDDEVIMLNILATIAGRYFGQSEN